MTNEQWIVHMTPEEREQTIRENVVVPCDLAPDDFCTMDCDACMEEYTKKWLKAEVYKWGGRNKMINFEWIKSLDKNAMSDFLCSDVPCVYCAEKGNIEGCDSTCLSGILLWLEREHDGKLSYWLEEEHDASKQ